MELTFWTSYVETKECQRYALTCEPEDMDKYLFGNLTIKNVNTKNWVD